MSKHHLRSDKTCQNCGHEVPERFCSFCGQENVESRQSFGHLAGHFLEDLTHYEGRFWKTVLYLIARPAYLTKAYLAGKRNSFVPPVRLYFFISFVTFLLPNLLPDNEPPTPPMHTPDQQSDSLVLLNTGARIAIHSKRPEYRSIKAFDSAQATLPEEERVYGLGRWIEHKRIELDNAGDHLEHFSEAMRHNFPKSLFIYLPLFAFVLWLFHGKKRWLYFDHAIFVIHYFCFMMLVWSLLNLVSVPLDFLLSLRLAHNLESAIAAAMFVWFIYYYFRAHHKMYHESWLVSTLKGSLTFFINFILFGILLTGLIFYTLATM